LSSRDLRRASVRGESQLKNHGTPTATATNKAATMITTVTHIPRTMTAHPDLRDP
jgi:hypothetical protein